MAHKENLSWIKKTFSGERKGAGAKEVLPGKSEKAETQDKVGLDKQGYHC
jgi:hypothetical protein